MKKYAVFLFDDDKEGLERHKYIEDFQTRHFEPDYIKLYYCRHIENVRLDQIEVNHLDMRISIQISPKRKVKFASQTTAYIPKNGGKSIVMAERIPKDEQGTDIPCAYCEGSGVSTEDGNTGETCKECNGTGTFSIQELIRTDNRPEEERSDER